MNIVITGAASGIGRATAELLYAAGGHRMLLSDRDAAGLDALVQALGPNVSGCVADLASPDCGERIVASAIAHMGSINAVVSNAGIIQNGSLLNLDNDDFERAFAINTRATWLLGKAAHRYLSDSKGAFIATASMSASQPTPGLGFYSSSKSALLMLIRQMALEWGPDGIRCNTVSPGPTHTPMTAAGYADPARRAQRESMIPLRKLGLAEDVAQAIIFLAGPHASHISGVDLLVDGGMTSNLMPATGGGTGQAAST